MAITTLDPKTALIVIDLQKAIMAAPTIQPPIEIAKQAAKRVALEFVELRRATWDHRKLGGTY